MALGSVTAFGVESVQDGLIICPPLRALDVFLRRDHYKTIKTLYVVSRAGLRAYLGRARSRLGQENRYTPKQHYPKSIGTSERSRLVTRKMSIFVGCGTCPRAVLLIDDLYFGVGKTLNQP